MALKVADNYIVISMTYEFVFYSERGAICVQNHELLKLLNLLALAFLRKWWRVPLSATTFKINERTVGTPA
jgi:hypothetical protein